MSTSSSWYGGTYKKVPDMYTDDSHSEMPRGNLDLRSDMRPVPRQDPPPVVDGESPSRRLERPRSAVNPGHYRHGSIEAIDVIEDWEFDNDYYLGNALKYIARCRHKGTFEQDLKKAIWYLARRVGCDAQLINREEQE